MNEVGSSPQGSSKLRRVILGVALVGLLIAGGLTGWHFSYSHALAEGRSALAANDFANSNRLLLRAVRLHPRSAEAHYQLARAYRELGKLDQVSHHLRRAKELGWNEDDIHRQQLLVKAQLGEFKEIEPEIRSLFERKASDEDALDAYSHLARDYLAQHHLAEARQFLNAWIEWRPKDIAPRLLLAQYYTECGELDLAETQYREVLKIRPAEGQALKDLGQLPVLRRESTGYTAELQKLKRQVARRPTDTQLRYRVGEHLATHGSLDEAAGWWHSALRIDPLHQFSHAALAKYYADTGDIKLATRHQRLAEGSLDSAFMNAWQQLQKGNPAAAIQILSMTEGSPKYEAQSALLHAALLNEEGQFEKALEKVKPALKHDQLRVSATVVQAEALHGLGDSVGGLQVLHELLNTNPNIIEAHQALATIYYDLEAANDAKDHLLKVAELDPNDPRPFRLLGKLRKEYDIFDRAVVCYQESLRRDPNQPERDEVLLELADCLIRVHDFDGAGEALLQVTPSHSREVLRAEYLFNLGRTDEAIQRLDSVLKEDPDHLRGVLLRADLHLVNQENEKAVVLFQHAAELKPFDHEIHRKYANALQRQGNADEAAAELAKSEELKERRAHFAELRERTLQPPYDPKLLRELADAAEQLGRTDSAKVWRKVAEYLD